MTLPARQDTATGVRDQRSDTVRFSVIVPTRGEPSKVTALLDALARQTLPAERREILVVFDGAEPGDGVKRSAGALGARLISGSGRGGPGAARNAGAAEARNEWLAFTEDDVTPAADWLQRAAERIAREPGLDVLEGTTLKPGGRRVHRHAGGRPLYLPTNLFVRRAAFEKAGGYSADYFDAGRGIYFREDADFGFTLEALGACIAREPAAVVEHPAEHPRWLDPLRWARRYEMDALLESRHPQRFRERIEVHRLGPFTIRRPFVRASALYVLALLLAAATGAAGLVGTAAWFLGFAVLAFIVIWAKWRFDLLRLPVVLAVPFVLVWAYGRGRVKVKRDRSRC